MAVQLILFCFFSLPSISERNISRLLFVLARVVAPRSSKLDVFRLWMLDEKLWYLRALSLIEVYSNWNRNFFLIVSVSYFFFFFTVKCLYRLSCLVYVKFDRKIGIEIFFLIFPFSFFFFRLNSRFWNKNLFSIKLVFITRIIKNKIFFDL